jgi:TRAP-type C4-dicarboxylate transport system permease small subunit
MPWRVRRVVSIAGQILVIAFFVLLGGVGVWITPVLATDALVSLPWIPMSVVQSVIPISAALIVVAEFTHLADLVAARRPPGAGGASLADATQ